MTSLKNSRFCCENCSHTGICQVVESDILACGKCANGKLTPFSLNVNKRSISIERMYCYTCKYATHQLIEPMCLKCGNTEIYDNLYCNICWNDKNVGFRLLCVKA